MSGIRVDLSMAPLRDAQSSKPHQQTILGVNNKTTFPFSVPESPLARTSRGDKIATLQDDSGSGRCSDGSPKAQHGCSSATGAENQDDEAHQRHREPGAEGHDGPTSILQDEHARRRELALRQHAFFQLRLHLRRGANLVAMDRCGEFASPAPLARAFVYVHSESALYNALTYARARTLTRIYSPSPVSRYEIALCFRMFAWLCVRAPAFTRFAGPDIRERYIGAMESIWGIAAELEGWLSQF